ncbi:hypothetical protein, partial [Streptomyces longispororuber]|uniref:hypothetical protein n=1 Tax=Streptomyces longispororuber TaxID=68230 RepID=UPI00210DE831
MRIGQLLVRYGLLAAGCGPVGVGGPMLAGIQDRGVWCRFLGAVGGFERGRYVRGWGVVVKWPVVVPIGQLACGRHLHRPDGIFGIATLAGLEGAYGVGALVMDCVNWFCERGSLGRGHVWLRMLRIQVREGTYIEPRRLSRFHRCCAVLVAAGVRRRELLGEFDSAGEAGRGGVRERDAVPGEAQRH